MSRSAPSAWKSSRLQTVDDRELRVSRYLVERALSRVGAVSEDFVRLVGEQCRQLGYDPRTATDHERELVTLEIATRLVPCIRAALRREHANRETIQFDPRDTQMM